jgi:hypothetical protein
MTTQADLDRAELEVRETSEALDQARRDAWAVKPPGEPFIVPRQYPRVPGGDSHAGPGGPFGAALRRMADAEQAALEAVDRRAAIRAALTNGG